MATTASAKRRTAVTIGMVAMILIVLGMKMRLNHTMIRRPDVIAGHYSIMKYKTG